MSIVIETMADSFKQTDPLPIVSETSTTIPDSVPQTMEMNINNKDFKPSKNSHMIDPETVCSDGQIYHFSLTKEKDCWITIEYLPKDLQEYANQHFDELFTLHPSRVGQIVMYNQEKTSYRYHQSYLQTPKCYTNQINTSYMFSGFDDSKNQTPLPLPFEIFYHYMRKEKSPLFNQVVANWYLNGEDYIAFHADCELGMVSNSVISMMNFNRLNELINCRSFIIRVKKECEGEAVYSDVEIVLRHGCLITMGGKTQEKFRHSVPKVSRHNKATRHLEPAPRFSLSFRQFQDEVTTTDIKSLLMKSQSLKSSQVMKDKDDASPNEEAEESIIGQKRKADIADIASADDSTESLFTNTNQTINS